jgi:hypothetical protein
MSYCRILLAKLLIIPSRALVRVIFDSPGFEVLTIGNCSFLGPPEFLKLCSSAMDQLSNLDPALSDSIRQQKLRIWYEPRRTIVYYGLFGIPEAFLTWQEKGVIACILYAHFDARLLEAGSVGRAITSHPGALAERAKAPVRMWLEAKGFPSELVTCFR